MAHASLVSTLANNKYVNLEVQSALNRCNLEGPDKGLYSAIVYGCIERLITLDFIISSLSSRPVSEIDDSTLCAIRIGICQMAFMDKIPAHAAVDESVELAPKKSRGFVNAILRSYLRKKPPMPKKEDGFVRYLSINYSVPEELCELFVRDFGSEAEDIFAAFLEREKIYLHLNPLRPRSYAEAEKLGAEKSRLCPDVVSVPCFDGALEGLEKGLWIVQDEASAYAAYVLGAKAGELVVDTCAAPGGKSFAIAMGMENKGEIHSFDLHDNKINLIKKGARKLGIEIISAEARNAKVPREDLIGKADKVLCDAPCSGLGVIGKKPDIKYKALDAIEGLPRVQAEVLRGAAKYVKPGGTLVYSTCTLNPRENEENVIRFLNENPNFAAVDFTVGTLSSTGGMLTLAPHIHHTDGFFIAKLLRLS